MGDLNDGGALIVQLLEEVHDLLALTRVQVARGLVGQNQLRLGDNGPRHSHELLLSARKLAGVEVFLADDVEPVERVGHDRLALRTLDVPVGEGDVQVFGDREVVEQMVLLKHEPDIALVQLSPLLDIHLVDGMVEKVIFTAPFPVEHTDNSQQGGLPGARRAHDGHELTVLYFDVDPPKDVISSGAGRIGFLEIS